MKETKLWVAVKLFRMLACVPRSLQFYVANILGKFCCYLMPRDLRVIKKNLSWCFSSNPQYDVDSLIQSNIRSLGQSVFDTGVAWFWTDAQVRSLVNFEVRGLDAFLKVQKQGDKGILLLFKHAQHLELDARVLSLHIDPAYGVARGSDFKILNDVMLQGRAKSSVGMSAKTNPRQFVRWLRDGKTVAYLPDLDYGEKRSVKTTLFGVPAVFSTAAYTLAMLSGCSVYFCNSFYEGKKLILELEQLTFPMNNAEDFSCSLARYIESKIAICPEEYLWVHRRFKSTKDKACYA